MPDRARASEAQGTPTADGGATTLDLLAVGERAVLGAPTAFGPTVLRLLEMGMTAGAEVQLTRRAPFGDPLEVSVRGTRLCLRRADAVRFVVQRSGRP